MNYQKDEKLLKVLKNKRVAIVGPSPHLIGKNTGHLIDQYDLVCRVNEIHPTGYEKDYGDRTDIVFHNCGTRFIDIFGQRLLSKRIISQYLKFVVCPCVKGVGSDRWQSWKSDYESPVVSNFKSINVFNTPFYWIGIENYQQIYNIFNSEPNAGQTALYILLEHEIKELYITGFSFYSQGNFPKLSHRPGHTNEDIVDEMIGDPGHAQAPQKLIFKKEILGKYGDKIKIDSYLNELLKCEHHNVVEL